MIRQYETKVQELKQSVLRAVAKLCWEGQLDGSHLLDVPRQIIPGPKATMRCCIYKERAIIGDRMKLAMGGDPSNPNMVEVLPVACDECPVTDMMVNDSCRGCIATRCVNACPKGAIQVVNHRSTIDHSKCISCGKCMTACPYGAIVKNVRPCERSCPTGAISMGEDKKASIDPERCIACGTCVNACPFGAIMDKSYLVDAIGLLKGGTKWGYRVYAILAPSIAGQFAPATLEQVVEGLKQLGFCQVEEVAHGADLTAWEESAELAEKGSLLSSCCPAFVSYVKKFHPKQAGDISHTPSPMVMSGREIKARDPEARVIFIGPCVAKKGELKSGKAAGAVDCVLTYEELAALLDSREIDLCQLEGEPLTQASSYGRGFAHSGGVAAAVAQAAQERGLDFTPQPVVSSGIRECNLNLLKRNAGRLDGNFIEGMACEGGCVSGAGCLLRSPKNRQAVEEYAKKAEKQQVGTEREQ
jgi:[FeFe] hydrogenase (group B1/B3)